MIKVFKSWFAAYEAYQIVKDNLDDKEKMVNFAHAEIVGDHHKPLQRERLRYDHFFKFVEDTTAPTYFEIYTAGGDGVATITLFPTDKYMRITVWGDSEGDDDVKEFTW